MRPTEKMIVMPSNNTGFAAGCLFGKHPGRLGHLHNVDRLSEPKQGIPWALDNGASTPATQVIGSVNAATPTSNLGTGTTAGNFANATLYVLSRAGTSLRFNGRFYGSTGRFGSMSDSERNNLTRWWMKRIGTA